jgi:hypothetical protein
MPIHPATARKSHLLEGTSSFQQFVEYPGVAERRKACLLRPDPRAAPRPFLTNCMNPTRRATSW